LRRGQRIDVGEARAWFLWALILLAPICFSATRYWLASLSFAAGQFVAFSPFLAVVRRGVVVEPGSTGLLICVSAIAIAWLVSQNTVAAANRYDRLWVDFRDTFGLFWALRVQERINSAARQYGWNLELTWSGFVTPGNAASPAAFDPAIEPTLRTTFKGLLRRFVSGPWIKERLAPSAAP